MGARNLNVKKSARKKRSKLKSHSRSGGVVNGYTQKTGSGIRIRVRGHIKSSTRVNKSGK